MGSLAVNPQTGEAVYFDGKTWAPAKIAENPQTGERVAWDGEAWKPLPTSNPAAAVGQAVRGIGAKAGEPSGPGAGLMAAVQQGAERAKELAALPDMPEATDLRYEALQKAIDAKGGRPTLADLDFESGNGFLAPDQAQELKTAMNARTGLSLAQDEAQELDILKAQYPDATFRKGPEGSVIATIKGKDYYVNKPGVSGADWAKLGAGAAVGAPLAVTGAGLGAGALGTFGRILGAGLGTAGQSVTQDLAARAYGSQQPVNWGRAGVAGLLGAGFESLGPLVSRGLRKLFPNGAGLFEGGKMTKQGEAFFRELGIDPTDLTPEDAQAFYRMAQNTDDLGAAARIADAQGLPEPGQLTTGQATRNPGVRLFETEAQKGTGGAATTLQGVAGLQDDVVKANRDAIQASLAGAAQPVVKTEGGAKAQDMLLRMAAAGRQTVDQAYDTARNLTAQGGTAIPAGAPKQLAADITAKITPQFDLGALPGASRVLDDLANIDQLAAKMGATGQGNTVMLNALEAWRTRATNAATVGGAEGKAIRLAIQSYDDWLDDAVTRSLITGDQAAIDAWKAARGLRKRFGELFEADDVVPKLIAKTDDNSYRLAVDPEKASNVIFGQAGLGAKNASARNMTKLKQLLGAGSDEWNGLRQEAFLRLFKSQPEDGFSEVLFAKALDKAMAEAPDTMRILFSPQELALMQRFKRFLVNVNWKPLVRGNINTSNTGIASAINRFMQSFGRLGRGTGYIVSGLLSGASDAWKAGQAMKYARGLLPGRSGMAITPGIAGAVGATMTDDARKLPAPPNP